MAGPTGPAVRLILLLALARGVYHLRSTSGGFLRGETKGRFFLYGILGSTVWKPDVESAKPLSKSVWSDGRDDTPQKYQILILELLSTSKSERQITNWSQQLDAAMNCQFKEIHVPSGVDLAENREYASQAALWGIEGLEELGEIYPLGGSGDRLGLVDPITGECLPAAMLPYCGRTLLEGLIRDLQMVSFDNDLRMQLPN
ncbi:hypothetical protein ACLOJK_023425 [Asimina triloba]